MPQIDLEIRLRENVIKAIRRLSGEGIRDPLVVAELESALGVFVAWLNQTSPEARRDNCGKGADKTSQEPS